MLQPQIVELSSNLLNQFEEQEQEVHKVKKILSQISNIPLSELNQVDSEDICLTFETYNNYVEILNNEPALCYWHNGTKDLYVIILNNLKIFCIKKDNWKMDIEDYYQC